LFNNNKNCRNEGQIRFIARARAGTLWIPERMHFVFNEKSNNCPRECGCIEILSHILNACPKCFREIAVRHNNISKILSQYLNKFKKQLITLEQGKKDEVKFKIGWKSRIGLPYITEKKDNNEEENTPEAARRRRDL
jgi:hypothetical protein